MEFPRQEHWSGFSFPPPGNLPHPGIKPTSLVSLVVAGRFFTTAPPGKLLHGKLLGYAWSGLCLRKGNQSLSTEPSLAHIYHKSTDTVSTCLILIRNKNNCRFFQMVWFIFFPEWLYDSNKTWVPSHLPFAKRSKFVCIVNPLISKSSFLHGAVALDSSCPWQWLALLFRITHGRLRVDKQQLSTSFSLSSWDPTSPPKPCNSTVNLFALCAHVLSSDVYPLTIKGSLTVRGQGETLKGGWIL